MSIDTDHYTEYIDTMNKQFDGYNDLHNTYSVKHHVPHMKPGYKGKWLESQKNGRGLLLALGISWVLFILLYVGTTLHNKAEIEALQRQNMVGLTMANEYSIITDNLLDDILKSYSLPTDPVEVINFVFGKDAPVMTKIAKCESGLNPNAKNKNSTARGLFQVMSSVHGVQEKWLYNPMVNALIAKQLYDRQGTVPWASSRECWSK